MESIKRYFGFAEAGTDFRTEILAGVTTFLTMAYIIFVNPAILGDAGMPKESVFVATCLVAALASLIMGLYANYPIACAPGMGLNAYFAYTVVKGMGFTWRAALGAVFISGCLFLLVTLFRVREAIVNGIPKSLRISITAGIGLFLGIISLKTSGVIVGNPATLVTLGDLHKHDTILAIVGFFTIVTLDHLRVRGAILIGIIGVTILSFFFGDNQFHGVFSAPPSIDATLFKLDIGAALSTGIINVILVFFLVELFDATGTLMGVANRAGLLVEGKMNRLNKALLADSTAIVAAGARHVVDHRVYRKRVGRAGRRPHGRDGHHRRGAVPRVPVHRAARRRRAGYATAPALLYVSCLMLREMVEVPWTMPRKPCPPR